MISLRLPSVIGVAIVKEFEAYEYPRVVATLIELADDEATLAIFHACVIELYRVKGCDDLKLVFVGKCLLFVFWGSKIGCRILECVCCV